ncbi:dynamin family protein [Dietzia sp.]|uniref:dynamin family protein n=1 Tax=Dietzia sp. TaxID=1871616 RepID=UPI002FD9AC71
MHDSIPLAERGLPKVTSDVATPAAEKGKTLPDYVRNAVGILRRYGHSETADLVESKFFSARSTANVVVVGEVKRGKSSLVNALLGRRDLLPTDVDESTSMPIEVLRDCGRPGERIVLHFGDRSEDRPLEELRQWSRSTAAPIRLTDETELPSHASVHIEDGVDLRAIVVDTPGAGGLDEAAVDLALSAARGAGVLVMVCDSTNPITAPEIDILRRAAETVGSVIVVVSKIDKALTRWRSIVEDNRRLIREYAGLDVPVFGVSSLRALAALELDDPERRHRVEKSSGIAALRSQLEKRARSADALSRSVAISLAAASLREIGTIVDEQIRDTEMPSHVVEELQARKDELRGLRDHGQEWEQFLSRNIGVSRQRVLTGFDAELDAIREKWSQKVKSSGLTVLRKKPQVFTAQIEAEISQAIQRAIGAMSAALRHECEQLFGEGRTWMAIADAAILGLTGPPSLNREVGKKTENMIDPSVVSLGILGGGGLATLGSSALASIGLSMVALPAVAVGGGWIAVNLAYRAMRNGKQHLQTWIRESCGTARVAAGRELDTFINLARTEMVVRYRAKLREEQDSIQERLRVAKEAAKADESTRREKTQRLRKNARIISSHVEYLENVMSGLPAEQKAVAL